MMTKEQIHRLFLEELQLQPTNDQKRVIGKLCEFLLSSDVSSVFVLKGYAGTGKTTLVSKLVKILPHIKSNCVLLAPTGRAAKVLAGYAGQAAFTIHRVIYRLSESNQGGISFQLQPNKHVNTLFIVDEASMITDAATREERSVFQSGSLLHDLVDFVYSGDHCRLILIGDSAQLPPVHSAHSPALSVAALRSAFRLNIWSDEMKEVVRQQTDSGILHNATRVRNKIETGKKGFVKFKLQGFGDIKRLTGSETADYINDAFSPGTFEETIVVCRSNKRANLYNKHIRARVLFFEDEIGAGDLLMVVKNNYFWLPQKSIASFIANGDIIEITRIQRIEEMYGFRFAKASIRMIDYPDEPELDLILLLDTLDVAGPSLSYDQSQKLFEKVSEDYIDEPSKTKRFAKIKSNPYLNAVQVKFAYAVTCHKAQGGQWKNVFVEMGYIPEKIPDKEYFRWLYTALTRATENLYLMGFSEDFFEG
ncbi:MAG: ATP-dependent DNA helicase [Bacteroidota bacterium]